MNQAYGRRVWIVLLCIAGFGHPAQGEDIRLKVLKSDEYALRRMVVVKKSGERINSFLKINSFDPAAGLFVMEGVTGETTSVPVSDIEKIEFGQSVREQSPMAQSAYFEIKTTIGSGVRYKISQGQLKVEAGDLILPGSSPSTSIPAPAVSSATPSPHEGSNVTKGEVVEARV
jgi:hypothetical protein